MGKTNFEVTGNNVCCVCIVPYSNILYVYELIPPCDTGREKVGALYNAVFGLLAFVSRAYPQYVDPKTLS